MAIKSRVWSYILLRQGTSVQFSSVTQWYLTLWNPMNCSTPGLPVLHQLLKFTQTHVHWWCHPTISSFVIRFSSCPQSFPASRSFQISQLFAIRWPKYWSFNFNISPSNEHPGLDSFRIDWLDLLAVQGTLMSLLQHHICKSISSSLLSFLCSPTLTSLHDCWKNHSLD